MPTNQPCSRILHIMSPAIRRLIVASILFITLIQSAFAQRVEWILESPDSVSFISTNNAFGLSSWVTDDNNNFLSLMNVSRKTPFQFKGQTISGADSLEDFVLFKLDKRGDLLWYLKFETKFHPRSPSGTKIPVVFRSLRYVDSAYYITMVGSADIFTRFNGAPQDTVRFRKNQNTISLWKINKNGGIDWIRDIYRKVDFPDNRNPDLEFYTIDRIRTDTLLDISYRFFSPTNDSIWLKSDSNTYIRSVFAASNPCTPFSSIQTAYYNTQGKLVELQRSGADTLVLSDGWSLNQKIKNSPNNLSRIISYCPLVTTLQNNGFNYDLRNNQYWGKLDTAGKIKPVLKTPNNSNSGFFPRLAIEDNYDVLFINSQSGFYDINDSVFFINQNTGIRFDTAEIVLLDKNQQIKTRKRLFNIKPFPSSLFVGSRIIATDENHIYILGTINNSSTTDTISFTQDGISYQISPFTQNGFIIKLDTLLNTLWLRYDENPFNAPTSNVNSIGVDKSGNLYILTSILANTELVFFGDTIKARSTNFNSYLKITDYSITRGEVNPGPYCAGDSFFIPYEAVGIYDSDNEFIAQLSDENGNFDDTGSIRELGRINATQDSIIRGTLPLFEVFSSGNYRIRIISTSPPVQSFFKEDSLRLLIYSRDKADPGPTETICLGDTFVLSTFGGTAWEWNPAYRMLSDSTNREALVVPDTTFTYRIVIADSSGCGESDTAFKTLVVRSQPKIMLPQDLYRVCYNEPFVIPASFSGGDTAGYQWQWRLVQGINRPILKSDSI